MTATKGSLIIPVENQVREFDPKLLLACVAARRGFSSVIGSRPEVDFRIAAFPRGIYLCKSMTVRSVKMFKIMRRLGHEIVTWDEEALVHLPAEIYFSRRLSHVAIRYVSHLFAWGQDNADLWRQYPELPPETAIHITGNPRGDILRPEMHPFYAEKVEALRRAYGEYILINTNFNHVNAFYPSQNLFLPVKRPGEQPRFGKAAKGMSREFAEALQAHKQAVFDDFKRLVPALDRAFPDRTIIVRPHPTENHAVYRKIAAECRHVHVTNEGNVVPWLLAAKVLIHNGCTTGVEAFVMGLPAITYRASVNEYYDNSFYRLPNLLGHPCFDFEELRSTVEKILGGEPVLSNADKQKRLIERYLAALEGPLASERIVDVLEKMTRKPFESPQPILIEKLLGRAVANGRRLVKGLMALLPNTYNRPEFQRHRYPEITMDDMRARTTRFQKLLADSALLRVEPVCKDVFGITA
jgi:surface carbohydrate biosynthesis protein